ncbi:hypothetical protein [Riemerella columbipharyngis]|uniref:Uncharacterized protein n=1 Tax=Riemerella columbipharyngis TaxID=1071918 RepID=A0A1G7FZ58_9FLAO|nr:hypothetical protein [Riemerella columbipharyngis]SDE81186.1 hypothetical protein SAMN05421544_1333 [Riemerella columbipharyngis]
MKNILKILALLVLFGCRTQTTQTEKRTEVQTTSQTQTRQTESSVSNLLERQEDYQLSLKNFGYDFTLKSQDSTKPARITEYRNGKPYREIVAKNAVYTEKKNQKDSTESRRVTELTVQINALKTQVESQQEQIKTMEVEQVKTKTDTMKIAYNFKYLLWVVMLLIAFIAYVFIQFKRLLKDK